MCNSTEIAIAEFCRPRINFMLEILMQLGFHGLLLTKLRIRGLALSALRA